MSTSELTPSTWYRLLSTNRPRLKPKIAPGTDPARYPANASSSWYQRVTINKGASDGIHRGDPVINGAGLVGKVEAVTGGSAVVTLITDQSFATGVIAGQSREPGSVTPAVGAPGDLLLEPIDNAARLRERDLVYTAGTTDSRLRSRYPAAILIGTVERIDLGDGELERRIHVKPARCSASRIRFMAAMSGSRY